MEIIHIHYNMGKSAKGKGNLCMVCNIITVSVGNKINVQLLYK